MKKLIIILAFLICTTTLFATGGISDLNTETDSLETGSWTNIYDLITTRYEGFAVIIANNTVDSVLAYRIKGFLYPDSDEYLWVADSTQITGSNEDFIEFNPSLFGQLKLDLINVSDSVNYQVDLILKNPNQ